MSSGNLLKGRFTTQTDISKRVIDSNELVAKKIEELNLKMQQPANQGFVPGLEAPIVEILTSEDESVSEEALEQRLEEATVAIDRANAEAQSIIEGANAEAEEILANARREAENIKKAAAEDGRKQGYSDGVQKAEQESQVMKNNLIKKEEELEEFYQKRIDELEPQFIDTLTGIYEHIFHVELKSYREILIYLISTTMRNIEGNRNYIVHVSKEDFPFVSLHKKQIAAGATTGGNTLEIVEDLTLLKNECFIETEGGIFDCGLGTQLSELSDRLKILSYVKEEN